MHRSASDAERWVKGIPPADSNPRKHIDMKNKHSVIQSLKIAILALALLPLVALQTTAAADKEKEAPDTDSVIMCAKCKTVWVNAPVTVGGSSGKGGVTIYRQEKSMKCADCDSAVATFFKTGKLQHECKACGSELTHCKAHK